MESLAQFFGDNITGIIAGVVSTLAGMGLVWVMIRYMINSFLTVKNMDKLGDNIRKYIEDLETKDQSTALLVANKAILFCDELKKDMVSYVDSKKN